MISRFTAVSLSMLCSISSASPADISYRSFSSSAAIGPPAEAFAIELRELSRATLGPSGDVRFARLPGVPPIPAQFPDVMSAVSAAAVHGGFDAAYVSGSDLNRVWGFIYNSGVPFGPTFAASLALGPGVAGTKRPSRRLPI
jgi:hypothetical protein